MNAEEIAYTEELKNENFELKKERSILRNELTCLKEQNEWFRRQIFGQRSEKVIDSPKPPPPLLPGFEEWFANHPQKDEEIKEVAAHKRRKQNRHGRDKISLPDDLPKETTILDIPEEEKICAKTGQPLVKIGEEITSKLAHKPGSYYIKEFIRPKYALPEGEGIHIQELPDSIIPKCRADESLLADILVKKFGDHLPLYRICEIFSRDGIGISRQLLSQWVLKVGTTLKPLYDEMLRRILASKNVFVDESPVDLLIPRKGKVHKGYMWVLVGGKAKDPPHRIYSFRFDRQHKHASDLLKDYRGNLHSDKYGAYEELANQKLFNWCPCWSHIRRKFFEAKSGDPPFRKWVLRKIRHLFMYERVAWARSEEQRLWIRQEKEILIIDELITKIKDRMVKGNFLPKSKFSEALGYFCGLIPHLKNYTKDPYSRIDNNVAERAVRPLAIGRKNWLFVGSMQGGEAAATILSLVQSCRVLKINPREYLEDVLRRFMSHNFKQLHELLPGYWRKPTMG